MGAGSSKCLERIAERARVPCRPMASFAPHTPLSLLLTLGLLATLLGCGGGGSPVATGSVIFTLAWPTRAQTGASRVDLTAANSLRIQVHDVGRVLNHPSTELRFDGLPVGDLRFVVTAYSLTNASGAQLAQASGIANVRREAPTVIQLSADASFVTSLVIGPVAPSVEVGGALQLSATPVDHRGRVVLAALDAISWTSDDASVAAVDATGRITGVSVGSTTLTAIYTDDNVTLSNTTTVIVRQAGTGAGPQAVLAVASTPGGARIFVNGEDTGQRTPADIVRTVQQNGSQFQVAARLAGYEDATAVVTARPNERVPVVFTLQASHPPAIPPHTITGKVMLSTGIPATDASVVAAETTTGEVFTAILDTAAARAGTYYIFAPPGTFRVTASKAGYQSQTREVTIISGEDRQTGVDFTLSP